MERLENCRMTAQTRYKKKFFGTPHTSPLLHCGVFSSLLFQVEKTLEQRAISVNLHPEVEEACRGFLIMNCADKTGDGQEVVCLQVGSKFNY